MQCGRKARFDRITSPIRDGSDDENIRTHRRTDYLACWDDVEHIVEDHAHADLVAAVTNSDRYDLSVVSFVNEVIDLADDVRHVETRPGMIGTRRAWRRLLDRHHRNRLDLIEGLLWQTPPRDRVRSAVVVMSP